MYERSKISQAVLFALSAGALGATAQAQEDRRQIEEITVTATKVEESLQEVPIAVTALSGDDVRATRHCQFLGLCHATAFRYRGW